MATGDEHAGVRTWDMRVPVPMVGEYSLTPDGADATGDTANDEVTDMWTCRVGNAAHLLATCGDGTLTAIDVRKRKVMMRSEVRARARRRRL